jgi:transglutaminase-like putative cysteine protease
MNCAPLAGACRIATAALLVAACAAATAQDAFNYTVRVANFDRKIYAESVSRYRLSSSNPEFTLLETGYQKITGSATSGGKRTIEIRTGPGVNAQEAAGELTPYLADTRFLNLSSPEITRCAAGLTGAADPLAAVEDFVYRHIVDKDVGIPIIPAVQVYSLKRGDCTEHSVLAVALLRKMGVPARAVVGMYLAESFRGKRDVFVYHMWVEAYLGGRWRLVDAANPGPKGLNRYIALASHNLKTEMPLSYLRAVSAIQDLTVAYLGGQ